MSGYNGHMSHHVAQKLIAARLVEGDLTPGVT